MLDSTSVELEPSEPDKQPPDKFQIPKPKHKSAFQAVVQQPSSTTKTGTSNLNLKFSSKFSIYEFILKKALRNPNDITDNEKMILRNHPVIAELIKQTQSNKHLRNLIYYIPFETIINDQCHNYEVYTYSSINTLYYHSAKIPELYDSREKWSFEEEVVQYTPPQDEERLSGSTKGYSDYNLMLDEDDQKTIGKYTVRERREKIQKYKLKLQKYKLGLSKTSHKYKQRSMIAKSRPRVRGKFAKNSQSA